MLPSVASSVANVPVSVSDVLVEVEVLPPTLASSIYDWVDASVDGDDDSMMSIVIPICQSFLLMIHNIHLTNPRYQLQAVTS